MSWLEATRARLRLLFARRAAESRMDEEFRLHLEMETGRLVSEAGLDPHEARRRALVTFGGVEKHKEALREGRGLAWLSGMSLDLKLGLRMLVKYPALSLVGILGMAVAVAIGTVSFAVIYTFIDPTLPLDEGDRVVAIQNLDGRAGANGRRTHLHDLVTWREALPAVEDLGAYRMIDRNLMTVEGQPAPVRIAEMTASGFRVARVPPLLGRYFREEDERGGAPAVVVIGYDLWQSRFAGDSGVLGRTLQLGATPHAVVGVMPEGFAFPVNNRVWTPLRLDPLDFARGHAPSIDVFGRLAPGASLNDAQTQLTTIGQRLAADFPESHQHIRPRVLPYPRSFIDSPEMAWVFHFVQLVVTMLLVVVGTNVAILVYARTTTRMGEITVRSALGASRARIVAQFFAEALVLSGAAAAVGLVAAWVALRQLDAVASQVGPGQLPFWMDFGLSPGVVTYVAGLAVLGAVIVGVAPSLRATRRQVHSGLQLLGRGGSGMRLGKIWTVLIVTQVAVTVAILPVAVVAVDLWLRHRMAGPGFPAEEFLTARLHIDREYAGTGDTGSQEDAVVTQNADLQAELVRRLEAEPGIADVVLASAGVFPGDEPTDRIEVDRATGAASPDTAEGSGSAGHRVGVYRVGLDFFRAFDVPLLAGRPLRAGDASAGATAVIVNRSFVQEVLGGGEALGRRVRPAARPGGASRESVQARLWYEIVGVVADFPRPVKPGILEPKMYHALEPGATHPVTLVLRVRGTPAPAVAGRLRELAVAVDPMLRLERVGTLDDVLTQDAADQILILVIALVTLSVVLLSAAGIYALMSCTISLRHREIGIRSALGARPRRLILSVLLKAMRQIAIGIFVGTAIAGLMQNAVSEGVGGRDVVFLLAVAAFMMGVGLLAAVGPARRALQIQPTEALKAE